MAGWKRIFVNAIIAIVVIGAIWGLIIANQPEPSYGPASPLLAEMCANQFGRLPQDAQINACTDVIKAGHLSDEKLAAAYFLRGLALKAQGKNEKALVDFSESIRLNQGDDEVLRLRGDQFYLQHDYDLAIQDYDQAIRLNPNNASAYNNRALAYATKRDYDHAIADYDQAVQLEPTNAMMLMNRGLAKLKNGDEPGGNADLANAKKLGAQISR